MGAADAERSLLREVFGTYRSLDAVENERTDRRVKSSRSKFVLLLSRPRPGNILSGLFHLESHPASLMMRLSRPLIGSHVISETQ